MLLLGATFTSEYAIEGAALCNPSIVAHPDQTGTAAGSLRFVMSVRGIGEGHRSSIGFRTGVVDAAGLVTIDDPARFATVGAVMATLLDAAVFRSELARLDDAGEAADYVLDALGDRFTRADLDEQLDKLQTHLSTRGHAQETISEIRAIADRTYAVEFADHLPLSERVLWPSMGAEEVGMEDARLSASSTTTARSPSMPPTRPTADLTSASNSSRQAISSPSPPRRSSDAPRPIRAWHCFPAGSTVDSPPCRDQTANRTRSPTPIICAFGRVGGLTVLTWRVWLLGSHVVLSPPRRPAHLDSGDCRRLIHAPPQRRGGPGSDGALPAHTEQGGASAPCGNSVTASRCRPKRRTSSPWSTRPCRHGWPITRSSVMCVMTVSLPARRSELLVGSRNAGCRCVYIASSVISGGAEVSRCPTSCS